MEELRKFIRDIPDFPKKGIVFKDITPLIQDPTAFRQSIDMFKDRYSDTGIDIIMAIDARGFIFGSALAVLLGKGIVPVRKVGKLPYKTFRATYELEYGTDEVEIHQDAVRKGQRVLIVDDLLATGGTAGAAVDLVLQSQGKVVECAFVIELSFLNGRKRLKSHPVFSLMQFED